ncbi:hypothetical protein [Streptomyces sp. NPDC058486]|uniref:hypothetical protein n=1 Tax=unclassified Streptomyces TaxID=2593676 RepID=UPI003665AB57
MSTPGPQHPKPTPHRPLTRAESHPGSPSRALRLRAADGWERFMRRLDATRDQAADT